MIDVKETVTFNPATSISEGINAIAYNPTNQYLYGMKSDVAQNYIEVVEIHADGTYKNLGTPFLAYPHNEYSYYSGTFTNTGIYLLTGGSPYLQHVKIKNDSLIHAHSVALHFSTNTSATPSFSDIAIHPTTQICYGFEYITKQVCIIDIYTGQATPLHAPPSTTINNIGSLFFKSTGELYGYHAGELYNIDVNTGVIEFISEAPPASFQDGCSCPYSLDFYVDAIEHCNSDSIRYLYTLINNSADTIENASLSIILPEGIEIASFPLSNTYTINPGSHELTANQITIYPGTTSFEVVFSITDEYTENQITTQPYVHHLPSYFGDTVFSDNPNTVYFDDPTIVERPFYLENEITICEGDSASIYGIHQHTSGLYKNIVSVANQCDSIYATKLTVIPTVKHTVRDTICQGTTNLLVDNSLTIATGEFVHFDTLSTPLGCDSIVETITTIIPQNTLMEISICEGESFVLPDGMLVSPPAGKYTYTDSMVTSTGCVSTTQVELTVHPSSQTVIADSLCEGNLYLLPDGSTIYPDAGRHQYISQTQTIHGCDSIVVINLIVSPMHQTELYDTICFGEQYIFPDQTTTTTGGTYYFSHKDARGCHTLTIHLYEQTEIPTVDLHEDIIFCIDDQKWIHIDATSGTEYLWNTGETSPSIQINHAGEYTAQVRTDNTCWAQDVIQVTFEDCLSDCAVSFPTAYTPNSDGTNDIFRALTNCRDELSSFELHVFNRWGELVFSSDDITNGWDGYYQSTQAPQGTYIYYVTYSFGNRAERTEKGNITLIR